MARAWEVVEFDRLHGRLRWVEALINKISTDGRYLPPSTKTTE
jgi:hypothetical protein